jgi:hypothetical protein
LRWTASDRFQSVWSSWSGRHGAVSGLMAAMDANSWGRAAIWLKLPPRGVDYFTATDKTQPPTRGGHPMSLHSASAPPRLQDRRHRRFWGIG